MSNDTAPQEGDTNVDSRRRKMLAALGAGGLAGVAGCSGGGGGDGTDTATETATGTEGTTSGGGGTTQEGTTTQSGAQMVDITMQALMAGGPADGEQQPISDFTFLPYSARSDWPRQVYPVAMDVKADIHLETREFIPHVIDEWETSSNEIHFHVREEAKWSDGSDITAKAFGLPALVGRHLGGLSPSAIEDQGGPQSVGQAITRYEWDGKDLYFRAPEGSDWFDQFYLDPWLETWLTHPSDTEVGVWADYWQTKYDKLVEKYPDMAGANSGDQPTLWNEETTGTAVSQASQAGQYWDALLGGDGTIETNQQESLENDPDLPDDPTELKQSGAYILSQLREDGITLTRNTEHYSAGMNNWPEVNYTLQPEPRAQYALWQNDRVDIGPNLAPPEQVIESFPSNIQPHSWGGGDITALTANYQREYLGTPQVRWALLQALDKQQLVDVGNKYTTRLLSEAPGLHVQGEDKWIPQELQNGYKTYAFDRERAAELLRQQGFTRESNQWRLPNGDRWQLELVTAADQINMEATIVSQLNDFGISVSLRKLTDTLYNQRLDNGNYDIALHTWGGGIPSGPAVLGIYYRALTQGVRRRRWGLFSDQVKDDLVNSTEGITQEQTSWTSYISGVAENYEATNIPALSLQAPPVGKPNSSEMVDYPVVYWGYLWGQNISEEKRKEIIQGVTWVYNWRLAPFMPFVESTSLAFQDHSDWNVPSDDAAWNIYLPQYPMIQQGQIQAKSQ